MWAQQIINVAQVCMVTLLSPAYIISDLKTFITAVCWEILISSKQLKIMPGRANWNSLTSCNTGHSLQRGKDGDILKTLRTH